jgi:multicomponent Na+:H+ antiporter subunit B
VSVRGIAGTLGALGLGALGVWSARDLPPATAAESALPGFARSVAPQRHVTALVGLINFDMRGFDTLGEEFILLTSVAGVALILRREKDAAERGEENPPVRAAPAMSAAVRALTMWITPFTVLFGFYVATHGQLTPGGGFQAGSILATAPLVVYVAGGATLLRRIVPRELIEAAGPAGAAGFVVTGLLGPLLGAAFLRNVLPLGPSDPALHSGGTIPVLGLFTALEVSCGFVLLLALFLDELVWRRE